jgi:GntR family transcriptional repressor for pyruvate dehydrogenase complex
VLAEGELLPREVDLAARFGVSRGVARESIRALEERGLVTVKHGRGATVAPSSSWDIFDSDVLGALLTGPAGAGLIAESIECREILEVEAAALAAERASADDLRAMADAYARMAASASRARRSAAFAEELYEADVEFHQTIARAARNRPLSHMLEPIHGAIAAASRALLRADDAPAADLAGYQRILSAIAGRDPEAARAAMRDYLAELSRSLRAPGALTRSGHSAAA